MNWNKYLCEVWMDIVFKLKENAIYNKIYTVNLLMDKNTKYNKTQSRELIDT